MFNLQSRLNLIEVHGQNLSILIEAVFVSTVTQGIFSMEAKLAHLKKPTLLQR